MEKMKYRLTVTMELESTSIINALDDSGFDFGDSKEPASEKISKIGLTVEEMA